MIDSNIKALALSTIPFDWGWYMDVKATFIFTCSFHPGVYRCQLLPSPKSILGYRIHREVVTPSYPENRTRINVANITRLNGGYIMRR
jgi:hypothetical protein